MHPVYGKKVQVLHFQKEGVARKDTEAVYKRTLNPDIKLHSLTLCFRLVNL